MKRKPTATQVVQAKLNYSLRKALASKRTKAKRRTLKFNKSQALLGNGLPKSVVINHKYHSYFQLTSTVGSTANQQFTCNGMTDPDISGGGHQPMNFDQLAALYNHYTVIGSKIIFRISQAATTNGPMLLSYFINDDNTITPAGDSLAEQSTSKTVSIPTGSNNIYTLRGKWSAKKFFRGSIMGNTDLRGNASNNPAEASLYTITAYNPLGGTSTVNIEVFIQYIAVWTELKDIAGS